jgi:hypothetical protein
MIRLGPERDFATRLVLFSMDVIEEYQYAMHGGTAFVVKCRWQTICPV